MQLARLSLLLMAILQSTAALAEPFALSCEGSWYSGEPFGKSEKKNAQQRRYVLDEENQQVAYWNEVTETLVPACDKTWQSCEVTFAPTEIKATGRLNSNLFYSLVFGRRSGSVDQMHIGEKPPHNFYLGRCELTEIPTPNYNRNKF